jgi:dTDP-4-dehydrorhamnose 3,5-epimerase
MKVTQTALEGVLIIEPDVFGDSRGWFCETYSAERYAREVVRIEFVQDNASRSRRGVIRGLHYQKEPHAQTKLVSVAWGRILDVAVDIRPDSPTLGRWVAVELSADNHRQLLIPRGFAHGFSVHSNEAVVSYKCDNYYAPTHEAGILWSDPTLAVNWQIEPARAIVSDKDRALPLFQEYLEQ